MSKPTLPKTPARITQEPFAEVIESTLSSYLAQSWEWDFFPHFGELVTVNGGSSVIFGIVTDITTGSLDGARYPFPYKKTEEELRAEQPQIFEFLKTTFKVYIVGYRNVDSTVIHYALPSHPCKIHAFVHQSTSEQKAAFFSSSDFLHVLGTYQGAPHSLEELLLAVVRNLSHNKILADHLLSEIASTFSLVTSNDYRRLKIFLGRIQKIV